MQIRNMIIYLLEASKVLRSIRNIQKQNFRRIINPFQISLIIISLHQYLSIHMKLIPLVGNAPNFLFPKLIHKSKSKKI